MNWLCTISGSFSTLMKQEQEITRTHTPQDFEQVLLQYSPMIYRAMNQLHVTWDREEFFAEGRLALYEAFLNFSHEKGNFSAYAFSYIRGTLLKKLTKEAHAAQVGTLELCQEMSVSYTDSWNTNIFIQQVFDTLSSLEQRMFILVFVCDLPIVTAVKDSSIRLTYRQGKYLIKGIRERFKQKWRDREEQ